MEALAAERATAEAAALTSRQDAEALEAAAAEHADRIGDERAAREEAEAKAESATASRAALVDALRQEQATLPSSTAIDWR